MIKQRDHGFTDFMMVINHYFDNLKDMISEMKDPRNRSYITYDQKVLVMMGILKNVLGMHSMRQMDECFNEENCIEALRVASGVSRLVEMPHRDTLNCFLERLEPSELSGLRNAMIRKLIRGKHFNAEKLMGRYWRVILDGTGLFSFRERHCPNCLCETRKLEDGSKRITYYHKVVEAKIVFGEKCVMSLGTEFIENEREDVAKQDCENNAARRLLARIKKEYPRLPVCLQGDALYCVEPIMGLCREYGWEYLFTQKETRQGVVGEWAEYLKGCGEMEEVGEVCDERGTVRFRNGLNEEAKKKETMNFLEYCHEKGKGGGTVTFQWLTSIRITKKNAEELVNCGRGRWKIENEGFNNQKNGLYRIEHINSQNGNAMKNHYLLTQVADILMQLYLAWNPFVRKTGQSIKNTSSRLLESFRRQPITDEDVSYITRHTSIYLE